MGRVFPVAAGLAGSRGGPGRIRRVAGGGRGPLRHGRGRFATADWRRRAGLGKQPVPALSGLGKLTFMLANPLTSMC